jgi:23S rRNA (cytosine1962-C5)-methyltransferase
LHEIQVNRRAAGRIEQGHPWIYASDVPDRGAAEPGDAVLVKSARRTIGTAHYSSTSKITLRLLSRQAVEIDRSFFRQRLEAAKAHRDRVVSDSAAYRLCYSEGDLLPGLIVDRYGDYLSVQLLSQGMDRAAGEILEMLQEVMQPKGIVLRNDAPTREHEGLPLETRVAAGEVPEEVRFQMNGLDLSADLIHGQKTGIFLDQRENYRAAARYAHGVALDCFTSTGGFALHMAPACETIEAVDSSERALGVAQANAAANGIENIRFREADVFDLLSGYAVTGRRYHTVILDPPALAKSRGAVTKAMRAYHDINFRALKILATGGVLVTCSCSHHVSEEMLTETVASAAQEQGKTLRVLERRVQPPDHPILMSVPETLYLKCLIVQVV